VAEQKICPFCVVDGNKNRIFWEGTTAFATFSNPRLMEGHLLVIPKRHVGAPFELYPQEYQELFATATRFQKKLIEFHSALWRKPAGCDMSIHTRPFMPQTELAIPGHVHVHLRPRYFMDPYWQIVGRHEDEIFEKFPPDEMDRVHSLFAGFLAD
jgi:diadenosine tetraphosphate (Ap4A) HIT family hydrolase